MSYIQNLYTSRDNNANAATYVGQQNRLWWDPVTNAFYSSNGNTPGGIAVGVNGGNISTGSFTATSGNIIGDLVVGGNISPASNVKIGGVRAGPGANISNTGLLTIDTTGLPLSFGNFTANNNILTIVNMNENMILETQGNAEIQMIGNIGFYQHDGTGVPSGQYFKATVDGQIFMYVPTTDTTFGAVEIVGSTTGCVIAPGLTGAMLHVTGQKDSQNRLYFDGNGDYVAINGRSWKGNIQTGVQAIRAGNDVIRLNATAATNAGVGNVAFAQIRFTAIENQTTTAQGSNINFWTTAAGTDATTRVEVANISVATGVAATKFTTPGTVIASANVSGGNINTGGVVSATGNVRGGNINTAGVVSATGNINGGNILTGGLISVTGNINGGNIIAATAVITPIWSVSGNITGGNILTSGLLSVAGGITSGDGITATGNISGGNIQTSGVLLNNDVSTSGNVVVDGVLRYNQAVNNATASGFNKSGGTVTANGRTGQITSNNDTLAKGAAGTFIINNNYITSAKDIVIVNIASGASGNAYSLAVTAVNAAGNCHVTITNNSSGSLAEALVFNFAVIKVS